MPSKAKRPRLSDGSGAMSGPLDYSGDTIEIHVENNKFHIPKKLICNTSEFFKNAAKPEWTRDAQPLVLEEETVRIFGLYTIWLYNGTLDRAESDLKTWEPLSQAYVMGERFMDPYFQAVILEAMAHRADTGKKPDIMTINDIYLAPRSLRLHAASWSKSAYGITGVV